MWCQTFSRNVPKGKILADFMPEVLLLTGKVAISEAVYLPVDTRVQDH